MTTIFKKKKKSQLLLLDWVQLGPSPLTPHTSDGACTEPAQLVCAERMNEVGPNLCQAPWRLRAAETMEPCWEAHHLGYKWAESQKKAGSPPPQGLGDSQGTCRHSVNTFLNEGMREWSVGTSTPQSAGGR